MLSDGSGLKAALRDRRMHGVLNISCGFVPSLEAMPLLSQDACTEENDVPWRFVAFPSYGRILRHLLTGELAAGLVPWELFVTEVLARPRQKELWSVLLVLHACPTELVLGHRAQKSIQQARSKKSGDAVPALVFAIEAKRSLTKLQIVAWLGKIAPSLIKRAQFKVLPMDLMLKGLEAEEIDGLVAPTPWGLLAETLGCGNVDPSFTQGEYSQEVVLVCHKNTVATHHSFFDRLPDALASSRRLLCEPSCFEATATVMGRQGALNLQLPLLQKASSLYLAKASTPDFIPATTQLHHMLERLNKFSLLPPALGDLASLAGQLTV